MSHQPPLHQRTPLSLWARLAAFLGFLAIASALLAPVSMLAEDVRTGKLGGVCAVNTALHGNADAGTGNSDAQAAGSHCELCGSLGMALPPLAAASIPCMPGTVVAGVSQPAHRTGAVPGLPFSRGPPALLI
ncbi:MAG: DUF2946 family protein [Pseudomonadota bacterium]